MTLKSVVLPAPFGPMMPRRSPRRTSRLTSRTAVRPPKRFVTRSSVSTGPPGPQATGDTGQALGGEPHDEDEGRAVDDERSEEHTSELQSLAYLVCRLLLEKKK